MTKLPLYEFQKVHEVHEVLLSFGPYGSLEHVHFCVLNNSPIQFFYPEFQKNLNSENIPSYCVKHSCTSLRALFLSWTMTYLKVISHQLTPIICRYRYFCLAQFKDKLQLMRFRRCSYPWTTGQWSMNYLKGVFFQTKNKDNPYF